MNASLGNSPLLPLGEEAGTAPGDRAFRPDVEGLRAVAILLVVLFHTRIGLFRGGMVGVDAFFVISGFVITGLLLRERQRNGSTKLLPFYARRARRILPAALLVIVVSLIATALLRDHGTLVEVASDSRWTAVFLANFHFAQVLPNVFSTHPQNLLHYWSLAVEEQFYLVYPTFFIIMVVLVRRWSIATRLGIGLSAIIGVSLYVSVTTSQVGVFHAYDLPFARAWELAVGCLVAAATAAFQRLPLALAAFITWLGLIGLIVSAMVISVHVSYPGYAALFPVLSTALVIAGGAVAPPRGAETVLAAGPMQWIGRRSYSWYLWQPLVFIVAADFVHKIPQQLPIAATAALAVFSLAVAAASYSWVENPVRHSRWLAERPHAVFLGAGLLITSCVALTFAF